MMQVRRDEILKQLETIRREQGEEAYLTTRTSLARLLLGTASGEAFLKETFPDLDLEPLRKERAERPQALDFISLIRAHVPTLKTQAQFDLFMAAFNALTATLTSYFAGGFETGDKTREVLTQTLDAAKQIHGIEDLLSEIPEDQRSPKANVFTDAPKQFSEIEEQRRLLAELDAIRSPAALKAWYANERQRIDGVVTKPYRDVLFDAIREKQDSLSN
jgi:hypothetical protein